MKKYFFYKFHVVFIYTFNDINRKKDKIEKDKKV